MELWKLPSENVLLWVMSVDCPDSNAGSNASSGNNAGSGAGNSNASSAGGNDAEMKPLFCWKCPAGYILGWVRYVRRRIYLFYD